MRETIMASKSLKKIQRTQKLGQNKLITILQKQGREIHDQDKIIERIEEFYTELYDSEQSTATGNDHIDMYALVCVGMYKYACNTLDDVYKDGCVTETMINDEGV